MLRLHPVPPSSPHCRTRPHHRRLAWIQALIIVQVSRWTIHRLLFNNLILSSILPLNRAPIVDVNHAPPQCLPLRKHPWGQGGAQDASRLETPVCFSIYSSLFCINIYLHLDRLSCTHQTLWFTTSLPHHQCSTLRRVRRLVWPHIRMRTRRSDDEMGLRRVCVSSSFIYRHYDIYVLNLPLTPVMHIFENCFEKPISDAELRE
jgi:hypothetical protein